MRNSGNSVVGNSHQPKSARMCSERTTASTNPGICSSGGGGNNP